MPSETNVMWTAAIGGSVTTPRGCVHVMRASLESIAAFLTCWLDQKLLEAGALNQPTTPGAVKAQTHC